MARAILAVVVLTAVGCSSVKVVQRDGCWVRRTERPFARVTEELGPCARPATQWAEDRTTRIVQECVVQADFRWQARAVTSWTRGEPLPARPPEESVLADCMQEAATTALSENERLAARLAEVSADREVLAARVEADRKHLVEAHDRLALDLGEAAKKEAPPAIATATASSDGRTEAGPPPTVTVVGMPGTSAGAPAVCAVPSGDGAVQAGGDPVAKAASPARSTPATSAPARAKAPAPAPEAKPKPVSARGRRPPAARDPLRQQPGCSPEELAATSAAGASPALAAPLPEAEQAVTPAAGRSEAEGSTPALRR